MRANEVNGKIKEIYNGWRAVRVDVANRSYEEAMANIKSGQRVPEQGTIIGDNYLLEFRNRTDEAKEQAHKVISDYRSELTLKATDAPSAEAVSALEMFKLRYDEELYSEKERAEFNSQLNRLVSRYGDNYSAYEAFKAFAESKGEAHLGEHPVHEELRDYDEADSLINKS